MYIFQSKFFRGHGYSGCHAQCQNFVNQPMKIPSVSMGYLKPCMNLYVKTAVETVCEKQTSQISQWWLTKDIRECTCPLYGQQKEVYY